MNRKRSLASAFLSLIFVSGICGETISETLNVEGNVNVANNGRIRGPVLTSNAAPVGLESNVLFNALNRYTVTTSGPGTFQWDKVFDGKLEAIYSTEAPTDLNPLVIEVSGLPMVHTQRGAWIGWTTRWWPATRYKIEMYAGNGDDEWRTVVDHSINSYLGYESLVQLPQSGWYTKLRLSVYEASGTDGRFGMSELFFLHPEAGRMYSGLLPTKLWEGEGGKIGIGTKDPQDDLHIIGDATVEGTLTVNALDTVSPIGLVSGTAASPGINFFNDSNTGVFNPGDNQLGFSTAGVERLRIDGLGNVGIGGLNGAYDFYVNGNSAFADTLWLKGGALALENGSANASVYLKNTGSTNQRQFDIDFGTTNRFRINNNGNVGIGTTNPQSKLDIHGNSNFRALSVQGSVSTGQSFGMLLDAGTNASDSALRIRSANENDELFHIIGNGNVGVGILNPSYKFEVGGGIRSLTNGVSEIRLTSTGSTPSDWEMLTGYPAIGATNLGFWSGSSSKMTITPSGSVGIGTNSPSSRLSISGYVPPIGEIWGGNTALTFHNGSMGDHGSYGLWMQWNVYREAGTNNYRYLDYSDRPNAADVFLSESGIRFRTASYEGNAGDLITLEERLFIRHDGNVGIGTSSPDNKLDVKGRIRAEEIVVETGWADYVFEDGYALRSLSEVEAHIVEHGHLPGIPSASEVAEKGVSLGDSQRLLLEKVEELTLYAIEKDKRIAELEGRLERLEAMLVGSKN